MVIREVDFLKAKELHLHTQKIGNWVNWDFTCDQFLFGDPEDDVKGIAVSWMPTMKNLEKALASDCNLFVTHEPLYVSEADMNKLIGPEDAWVKKKRWLEKTRMIVYRCHDFWDDYPDVGIHGAWAKWLGFIGKPLVQRRFYEVHEVKGISVKKLAEKVLEKVRLLGQEAVQIVGDSGKEVSKIAIGTGAITNYRQMYDMGADVLLVTDDGTRLWESGQWALDMDVPLILVNHSTAEEPGMMSLTRYIQDTFPKVPVVHVPVGCIYKTITQL